MERMAEQVSGSRYQRLHHMLSESNWSRAEVRQQLIMDANTQFGHGAALVFDESAFAKKGDKSVGVARQWNGRLGKTENSQVRLRLEELHYSHVVFDAGYGHLPWLLNDLDDEGETFFAEIHVDQGIYLENPQPSVPERTATRGKAPKTLRAQTDIQTVSAWAQAQPESAWRRLSVRAGEKGDVVAEYL